MCYHLNCQNMSKLVSRKLKPKCDGMQIANLPVEIQKHAWTVVLLWVVMETNHPILLIDSGKNFSIIDLKFFSSMVNKLIMGKNTMWYLCHISSMVAKFYPVIVYSNNHVKHISNSCWSLFLHYLLFSFP